MDEKRIEAAVKELVACFDPEDLKFSGSTAGVYIFIHQKKDGGYKAALDILGERMSVVEVELDEK